MANMSPVILSLVYHFIILIVIFNAHLTMWMRCCYQPSVRSSIRLSH